MLLNSEDFNSVMVIQSILFSCSDRMSLETIDRVTNALEHIKQQLHSRYGLEREREEIDYVQEQDYQRMEELNNTIQELESEIRNLRLIIKSKEIQGE